MWGIAGAHADAGAILPVVAVPTTAGTGSEVGRAGVLTNPGTAEEEDHLSPGDVLPVRVICDPELTLALPPAMTAGTGLDAFAHCLEGYCAPHYHPMSQGIALEGMRLVKEYLPRAHAGRAGPGGARADDERCADGGCGLSQGGSARSTR